MNKLADTLGLKPGMSTYFAHAPSEYFDLLGLRTYTHRPDEDGTFQFIHAFFTEKDQLEASFGILASKLSIDGFFWVSVPKNNTEIDKPFIESIAAQSSLKLANQTEFANWDAYQFVVGAGA